MRGKPGRVPATCHPEKFQHAHGLCYQCYMDDSDRRARYAATKKAWRQANPERWKAMQQKYREDGAGKIKARERHYRRTYGIEPEQLEQMIKDRDSRCDICGLQVAKLHLDHDHETNKIRGLLCANCNTGLGSLGDTLEQLTKAVAYLRRAKFNTVVNG